MLGVRVWLLQRIQQAEAESACVRSVLRRLTTGNVNDVLESARARRAASSAISPRPSPRRASSDVPNSGPRESTASGIAFANRIIRTHSQRHHCEIFRVEI